jgi:hypothetical protein
VPVSDHSSFHVWCQQEIDCYQQINFHSLLTESYLHNLRRYQHLQWMEWWWCQAFQQDC